jgi:uncharacterized protein (DUF302 family)
MNIGLIQTLIVRLWPICVGAVVTISGANAMDVEGLTTIKSSYGPKETMDRLEAEVKARGLTVFARIDHAAGAAQADLALRPTEVLVFGNAKGGTPLMQASQSLGIDLPLRVLVWEDESGQIWLAYNEPSWLAKRHGLGPGSQPLVDALAAALRVLAKKATAP